MIVNHNTRDLLRSCLTSIFADQSQVRVVVVDNASSDGSITMVRDEFPKVILLENSTNVGYGKAANLAIKQSSAKYVLLLNADTRLLTGSIDTLINHLEHNPRGAIVGPRLVNTNGTIQNSTFPLPTPLDLFIDSTNLVRSIKKIPFLREHNLRSWSHDRQRSVPWLSGAVLAIRRTAFNEVGGFDESFYMYYEETDLCYRLSRCGWEIHFLPSSHALHIGGASTDQRRSEMTIQFYSSMAHFYRLHYSKIAMVQLVLLVRVIAVARWIRDYVYITLDNGMAKKHVLIQNMETWKLLLTRHWERESLVVN